MCRLTSFDGYVINMLDEARVKPMCFVSLLPIFNRYVLMILCNQITVQNYFILFFIEFVDISCHLFKIEIKILKKNFFVLDLFPRILIPVKAEENPSLFFYY